MQQERKVADRRDAEASVCLAVRDLVQAWPVEPHSVEELARSAMAPAVDRVVAAMVEGALSHVQARGWTEAEARRAVAKRRDVSPTGRLVLDDGLSVTPRVVSSVGRAGWLRGVIEVMARLADLPALPALSRAAGDPVLDDDQARMLEKVRALLAKAESTTFDDEAEACTAKAQELIARYSIDAALVESRGGRLGGSASVSAVRIAVDDPYAHAKTLLLQAVARENRCFALWDKQFGFNTIFGHAADLRVVELLFTSLLVQAVGAMQRAGSHVDRTGTIRTRSFRQSFLVAFANRIGERLREANCRAEAAAVDEVGDSFLPVLAARSDAAREACAEMFPKQGRTAVSVINAEGWVAGRAAADTASLDAGAPLSA